MKVIYEKLNPPSNTPKDIFRCQISKCGVLVGSLDAMIRHALDAHSTLGFEVVWPVHYKLLPPTTEDPTSEAHIFECRVPDCGVRLTSHEMTPHALAYHGTSLFTVNPTAPWNEME